MTRPTTLTLTRRGFLAGTAAGATLIVLHPYSARAATNQAHLRIMETTDLHVHVWPYDYYADKAVDTLGLARTASIIREIRAEATNSMLVDNGDFLQGNPMGDYIAYERGMKAGDMHPVIQAMNVLGYEASTLGNHEFNYGLDFLTATIAGANFPVVSANVVTEMGGDPRKDKTLVKPYVILDRMVKDGAGTEHPIRVGLIGFAPPQIMQWDRQHLEGKVQTRDIVATAEGWVPQMREEGCDIIIALSHSGIGAAERSDMMENASTVLARVDGIDAVMTGHSHLVFPSPDYKDFADVNVDAGTIGGKPAVMGGFWGSHMGLIDLLLERDGNQWKVVSAQTEARPIYVRQEKQIVPTVESQQDVLDSVKADHEATLAYVRRPVGKTSAPLYSYFALVADDPSVQVVNQAQLWYLDEMVKGTEMEGLGRLSAAAPFKAGGRGGPDYFTDVPAGDVAIKNVADLYLYPNTVRVVKITGALVKDWLERSAGIFNQITAGGADQPLINPDFPSYNYDVIDGVTYQIDLSQPSKYDPKGEPLNPEANRIVDLMYQGKPIDPAQEFLVATNNYRAGGGGKFPGADPDHTVLVAPDSNRDVLVRYIVTEGTINPSADANWRFKPMPGTTVTFDTGPKAAAYADKVPGMDIKPAGDGADGFARFRITL